MGLGRKKSNQETQPKATQDGLGLGTLTKCPAAWMLLECKMPKPEYQPRTCWRRLQLKLRICEHHGPKRRQKAGQISWHYRWPEKSKPWNRDQRNRVNKQCVYYGRTDGAKVVVESHHRIQQVIHPGPNQPSINNQRTPLETSQLILCQKGEGCNHPAGAKIIERESLKLPNPTTGGESQQKHCLEKDVTGQWKNWKTKIRKDEKPSHETRTAQEQHEHIGGEKNG